MQRAVIIAKGDVQGVGYRGVVKKIAIKQNILGRVRNIKPYDVEIIAEGEKENLKKFIEQIKVREFPINVENIEIKFEKPTGEFEYFDIERGSMEEELGERLDIARDVMNKMLDKQDQTVNEIKDMREDMNKNFTHLDTKYDKVSEKIDNIDKTLNRLVDVLSSK